MAKRALLPLFFLSVFLYSSVAFVFAQSWIHLGDDPTGETHLSGDVAGMYFYNDGVNAYFNETLGAASNTTAFTYTVYLDKPDGGEYSQDFRLVYSSTASELHKWNGTSWTYVEDIIVTTSTSPNSLTFNVSLLSIANPDVQQDTSLLFVNYVADTSIGRHIVDLVYDRKNTDAGDVHYSADDTNLYVEIYADSGWVMPETKLRVSKDSLQWTPLMQWPYQHDFDPPVTYDVFTVPLEDIGHGKYGTDPPFGVEPEDVIYIAVHAVIVDGEGNNGNAYAGNFKGHCIYTVPGDRAEAFISYRIIPELPWPTPLVFIPSVATTVYVIYRRRFRQNG